MKKEYMIQFSSDRVGRWINVKECLRHPYATEEEAQQEMEERKVDHPWNNYRVVVRMVTEWEEV